MSLLEKKKSYRDTGLATRGGGLEEPKFRSENVDARIRYLALGGFRAINSPVVQPMRSPRLSTPLAAARSR